MNFTDHIWSTQCRSVVVVVSGTAGGAGLVSPAATTHMDWAIIVIPISSPLMIGHNCCSVPRLLHEVVNLIVHAIKEPRTIPPPQEARNG